MIPDNYANLKAVLDVIQKSDNPSAIASWLGHVSTVRSLLADFERLRDRNIKRTVANRPDYQQRVVDEKLELDIKREKLGIFMNGRWFIELPRQEQERLNTQAHIMTMYSAVLGARIAAFSGVPHDNQD